MREDANRRMAEHVIEGLKKRNMEGFYCGTKEEAAKLIMEMIEPGSKVTWGGSA
ncbi:MAG: LUD domain-containing protein, partial [Lachnospiraceae bacterium]|nr:LUD domain-containing protein [Lachnospiraceae bacterium]